MVKTGKSWAGMVAVVEGELEPKLRSWVLKFRSTFSGRAEGKGFGGGNVVDCWEGILTIGAERKS